jgi:predicted glycoside hydrolase/deacetylase ChbG (UPF0249 family)
VRYFFNRKLRAELAREIEAQFARFLELGFAPSYWDGHTHQHLHPVIFDLALPVAERLGFRAVRLVRERSPRLYPLIFQMLSLRALPSLRARGIRFADRTFGLSRSGKMDTHFFEQTLRALPDGLSEIYYHPGAESFATDAARVAALAAQLDVRLTNFHAR